MRVFVPLLLACFLSACGAIGFPGVYKIDVEQGNLVDRDMMDQLKAGMSRRQVRFILGTPLVEDPFNSERWDYPYVLRNGDDIIREAQVTVHFDGDSLVDVSGDYRPAWSSDGAASPYASDDTESSGESASES